MADPLNQSDDLEQEIDYNFFDDDLEDQSEKNNSEIIESEKSEIRSYSSNKKKNSVEEIISNNSDNLSSLEELRSSSSNSSKKSEVSSHHSSTPISDVRSSSPKISKSSALSRSPKLFSLNSRNSTSESDVTTVSSLDSEHILKTKSTNNRKRSKVDNVTHINDPEDIDRVQPEAILRAMIRIHEERRTMRHLRPKWVDPTTKDYSVSGITKKINLVPEKIVSMSKKNIRDNPFYFHYREPSRRPYHTAINREKELERIEKENRTIYDRLKKVQPSPGITKQQLLKEYTKVSRFSLPTNYRPFTAYSASSYTTLTASNSRSSSQNRQIHSSASMHKSRTELESSHASRSYGNGRVMSAGSLHSNQSRPSTLVDKKKVVKK